MSTRTSKWRTLALLCLVVSAAMSGWADSCSTGTAQQLLAIGTCTVGNVSFNFTGASGTSNDYDLAASAYSGSSNIPLDRIFFSPYLSGSQVGFTVWGLPDANTDVFNHQYWSTATLLFSAQANSGTTFQSASVTLNNAFVYTSIPTGGATDYALVYGSSGLHDGIVYNQTGSLVQSQNGTSSNITDIASFATGTTGLDGYFETETLVSEYLDNRLSGGGTARATLGFATLAFDTATEQAPGAVPEPSSLMLLTSGLGAVVARKRRQKL